MQNLQESDVHQRFKKNWNIFVALYQKQLEFDKDNESWKKVPCS